MFIQVKNVHKQHSKTITKNQKKVAFLEASGRSSKNEREHKIRGHPDYEF